MARTGIIIISLLLISAVTEATPGIDVELDVLFRDSTVRCQRMYITGTAGNNQTDTIVVFDSLSFRGLNRVSLFYTALVSGTHTLSIIDHSGAHLLSRPFKVSPRHATFIVSTRRQTVSIFAKDYLYPRKRDGGHPYFIFLLIYILIKLALTSIFISIRRINIRILIAAIVVFLLSAPLAWMLPIHHFWRLLLMIIIEYLLLIPVWRKHTGWLQAAALVTIVNIPAYGLVVAAYLIRIFA